MDLSTLTNTPGARKSRKRVGRGPASGHGKTSGKGHKGQKARKGHKHKLGFEGGQMPLVRRLPKRGFKNPNRIPWQTVNIKSLNRFEAGSQVTALELLQVGLIRANRGGVKILGIGDLDRKLTVTASAFSASAKAKIEAAGGTAVVSGDNQSSDT
jgi:large subunit ribosomal protein L15